MSETRAEALARLKDAAYEMGADAVVAMRYDTTAVGVLQRSERGRANESR